MTFTIRSSILVIGLATLTAPPVGAQSPAPDPISTARVHLGPLGVTPSIALTNFGVDSNVFNSVDQPQQDFTFTVSPEVTSWLRAGRSRTTLSARADMNYFQTFSSERSIDRRVDGRFEIGWNRLTPWIAGGHSRGRQRLGYEIDTRSQRVSNTASAGVDLRVGGKTEVGANVRRSEFRYEADALFRDVHLQDLLNRRTDSAGLAYRQALTVLTTAVIEGELLRDEFTLAPDRDSDGVMVAAGVDLDPSALISGRVRGGYRQLRSVSGRLPDYRGAVYSVGAAYTLKGRTRLEIVGNRDVAYSSDVNYPYYIQTGATFTVTPRLTNAWDLQGRAGLERLAYAKRVDAVLADRTDRVGLFGIGLGYHLGRNTRIGVNVDRQQRSSPGQLRDYVGYRAGASVTYLR